MLFTITGKHIEITDAIRDHAHEKTSKLPRFYNSINQAEVIIDQATSGNFTVEIIARGEHNNVFIVTETSEDAYKSIDIAVHKLERQLRKKKEKERGKKHNAPSEPPQ